MQTRDIIRELAAGMPDIMPSFGADIDDVHQHVFFAAKEEKCKLLLQWLKANQPCMFGRLGASGKKNINMDVCVIDGVDLYQDDHAIAAMLQAARKAWKEKCLSGHSNAILYYFSSRTLATTMSSTMLEKLFQRFAGFIFPEYAPIQSDTIYTESAPLDINGQVFLFKAGINFFHTTAHLTPNHDRRIPGGIVISVNSVGHYANTLVNLGLANTLQDAIHTVQRIAWFSIGNGGIGDEKIKSCSWHNINPRQTSNLPSRPKHIPENFDTTTYSALYQTDVLIPAELTASHTPLGSAAHQIWPNLKIEYFSAERCTFGDINFGMFYGYPIDKRFIQFNPWPPLHAENNGDFVY